ncbi:MAG: hypothetical protein Q4A32_11895, partial [Lachnospiraceae bacterium]|nr:hypothetical protein [Lachnospiraceae bacterium]
AAERKARRAKRAAREAKRKREQKKKLMKIGIPVGGVLLLLIIILIVRAIAGGSGKGKSGQSESGSSGGTAANGGAAANALAGANAAGAVANADGTITLADGTVTMGTLNADGSVTLEDGTVLPAGTTGAAGSAASNANGFTAADYSNLSTDEATILSEADRFAAMYDYDGAIARVQAFAGYESNQNMLDAIDRYTQTKSTCVAYNVEEIPHFFYHSLLNDDRGFKAELVGEFVAKDNDCWMCSVDEFNTITQQMYDYGIVLVSLHDLATETVDADGTKHFSPNQSLMLPPGKHPAIMSEDDLSYYHAYDNQGIASKLVLDGNGKVKCEYINEAGETLVGDYDVVPLLSAFIDAHPDFSYHNAHCMIALTGYNGVFGYRTDEVYKTREEGRLDDNQRIWLENHPDFDWDADVAEATKIADALKAEGYEFASHTWGHRNVQATGLESLIQDDERWKSWVSPIVGGTDAIIFAHGTDLAGPEDYSYSNEKFAYYKGAGYDYFANVDGSVPVWMQIRDNYVRDSRINIDGYRLEQAMLGNQNSIADMNALGIHDIESFFNSSRIRPVEIMN